MVRTASMTRPVFLCGFLFSLAAAAWPVDVVKDLEPGREQFVRLTAVEWLEVEDPAVASAEWLESGELLITGHKPGKTLVLFYAEGKMGMWRLRVGPQPKDNFVVPKVCKGLNYTPEADTKLSGQISDDKCRVALLDALTSDAVPATALDVVFEVAPLQAQLKTMQAVLEKTTKGQVKARYSGAGLVLEGTASEAGFRKTLWELFRKAVGRVALEDRVERPPSDGGTK